MSIKLGEHPILPKILQRASRSMVSDAFVRSRLDTKAYVVQ